VADHPAGVAEMTAPTSHGWSWGLSWRCHATLADGGAVLGTIGFGELLMIVVGVGGSLFWIWMLTDCIEHETSTQQRLMWAVIIAFGHILGGLAYFFLRRPRRGR